MSTSEIREMLDRAKKAKYPLQYAIRKTAPLEHSKHPPIREIILNVSRQKPEFLRIQDEYGMTPLHAAASLGKLRSSGIRYSRMKLVEGFHGISMIGRISMGGILWRE